MKTELEKFSDHLALMELCVQLEDEQQKILAALPKLKDEFSKEAKAEFARLTKQAEAIEWKLAEARGEYLKTIEANRAEFARMEQSIKAKGFELAEYSKRLQSEVPAPVEQKIKAIFETLPRPVNGKDGADGKDASLLTGFRGNWDADTTYKAGDWFTFRGSSYLVLRACKGQIPTKNAQGEPGAYYAVFAMSGSPGPSGNGVYLAMAGGELSGPLTVNLSGSTAPTPVFTGAHLVGAAGVQTAWMIDNFAGGRGFIGRRANGTPTSPSAVASGDAITTFLAGGYGSTGWLSSRFGITALAAEAWTDSAAGGRLQLGTALIGTLTGYTGIELDGRGRVLIGLGGGKSIPAWGIFGAVSSFNANVAGSGFIITDSSSSGAVTSAVFNSFAAPTLAATSASTYADAANVYIAGAPIQGTGATLTRTHALWIDSGSFRLDGTTGAGVGLGTLTDAPSAGNPDKWIPINSDGTQYWIPAWAA